MTVYYTDIGLPTGPALATATEAGISGLYLKYADRDELLDGIAGSGSEAVYDRFRFELLEAELKAYFDGVLTEFTVPVDVSGTPFQLSVWKALRRVAYGTVVTYGMLAKTIGKPDAARAVGGAAGANPVPILIPCHRVVSSGGGIGGYSCGLDVKRKLLAVEGLRPPYLPQ